MGISESSPAMENQPEQEERMEEKPEAAGGKEATPEEVPATEGLEEKKPEPGSEPFRSKFTEKLELPKVDRSGAAATPSASTVARPEGTSTPTTGAKSKAERKEEKKSARKEEKRNRKLEKMAKKAEESEEARDPVRRKLDAAMEHAGCIESVMLLEKEYKALRQDSSHRPNFYSLIDRIISNLKYVPRNVYGPPAGQEERIGLETLRKECQAEDAQADPEVSTRMEVDEESASRKRKLEELEEQRRVLADESARKQKELEDEAKRLRAVEEAERRAKEQRAKNIKAPVPVEAEKTKEGGTWFEQKSAELVEEYIHGQPKQQEKSKAAEAVYVSACKDSEKAQEDFISVLQMVQDSAQVLQKSMGKALEAAVNFGREDERTKMYTSAKEKCTRPEAPKVKARPQIPPGLQEKIKKVQSDKEKSEKQKSPGKLREQPPEEEPGKEWTEETSEDTWKVGRKLKSDEKFLECTYYPFSPEWQEKLRKELLELGYRGFSQNSEGEVFATRKFGWQFRSKNEFRSIEEKLEQRFGVRLVWKNAEVKGKSKAVDDWHCYPLGRGCMEKTDKHGNVYTIKGSLPPSKGMCSVCWTEGHWKKNCPVKEMVSELWEPALTVLVPERKIRKFYPMRNIIYERHKDEKDEYRRYYPAVVFADYGAVSSRISEVNCKKYKEAKRKDPESYPEIEPPSDERGKGSIFLSPEEAVAYAMPKSGAKSSDQGSSMAKHEKELLEMQDSAKKRRTKLLEEGKKEPIDVDAEPETPSKPALPAGHWENRPRRESLSPASSEATKEVLRQRLEEHKKEQLEEYYKKKRQEEEAQSKARPGPGPDEAGSDPSSDESSETSEEICDDPVQENPDGSDVE